MTVLHYAAKAGYVDVLMTLLESDDADVNMQVSAIIGNKSIEKTEDKYKTKLYIRY